MFFYLTRSDILFKKENFAYFHALAFAVQKHRIPAGEIEAALPPVSYIFSVLDVQDCTGQNQSFSQSINSLRMRGEGMYIYISSPFRIAERQTH